VFVRDPWAVPTAIEFHACGVNTGANKSFHVCGVNTPSEIQSAPGLRILVDGGIIDIISGGNYE